MLAELRLQGLGVIDDATLDLDPGLTVVTGETGAGKTMVVTGLGLLLGARADTGQVRTGRDQARVEGRLLVDATGPVATRAKEAGAMLDGDELIVARTVSREGRSRAQVGGAATPIALLGELAAELVAVHGQSDQFRLLHPVEQRSVLDRYAGTPVVTALRTYQAGFDRLQEVTAQEQELTARATDRLAEADRLRFGLAEIAAVDPEPGEDAALRVEAGRLGHAEQLRQAVEVAHAALTGEEGRDVGSMLSLARRSLEQAAEHDPALAAFAERVVELGYLAADLGSDLAGYGETLEVDPLRLAAVEERRARLGALLRRYGASADAVLDWAANAEQALADLGSTDEQIGALAEERQLLEQQLRQQAGQISEHRQEAAGRLGAAVTAELADLAMPDATVEVAVTAQEELARHGIDDVEIRLRPHPGAPLRPVQKGASGGELARVMLAVEVALAGADPVPTFVFDEVDAGVGGAAAVEVGRRLAQLARSSQVVVVTHLPQVAAFADRHLVVTKHADGRVTSSDVVTLDEAGRARELTRMLAGLADSELGRAHAEELLDLAAASKRA